MSENLKDFLVSIGFAVDDASRKTAEAKVADYERGVTAATDKAGQERLDREKFRQALRASGNDLTKVKLVEAEKQAAASVIKVHAEGTERLTKIDVEAQKKATERRSAAFKDLSKGALATEAVLTKVAGLAGIVGTALTGSSLFQGVVGAANVYAGLQQQSQRTGASVKGIQALLYGFSQVGVSREEANGSFEGFRDALARNPGLKFLLKGSGVDTDQTPDKVFAQLGKYFSSMPYNVALARAGQLGISENVLLAYRNPALAGKIAEGDAKPDQFGLDPDKAGRDAKEMNAAYERLATDLSTVKDKVEAQFFKPMAAGFNSLSDWLEKHPDAAVKFGEGMTAFAGLMTLAVVPKLLRLAGAITGVGGALGAIPAWVVRLLALPGVATGGLAGAALLGSTTAANAGEGDVRSDGIHMPDGSVRPNAVFDPGAQDGRLAPGAGIALPRSESRAGRAWRQRPRWLGGEGKGGARERLGGRDTYTADQTMPPAARGLLDTIAGTESPGYNTEYGGKKFSSYDDHPREPHMITSGPNAGRHSAAAGRYQFIPGTWDAIAKKYGITNFRPESQDQGAWYLAQEEYHRKTGRKLSEDLQSTDPKIRRGIGPALAGQWTSLPSGIEAGTNVDRFSAELDRNQKREAEKARMATTPIAIPQPSTVGPTSKPSTLLKPPPMPNPYGVLDPNAFKTAPLASASPASMYQAYDQSRGDSTFNQTVNVNGLQKPEEVASHIKLSARRGGQDYIRMMQGATQ